MRSLLPREAPEDSGVRRAMRIELCCLRSVAGVRWREARASVEEIVSVPERVEG